MNISTSISIKLLIVYNAFDKAHAAQCPRGRIFLFSPLLSARTRKIKNKILFFIFKFLFFISKIFIFIFIFIFFCVLADAPQHPRGRDFYRVGGR
jgi:hypothetical protein